MKLSQIIYLLFVNKLKFFKINIWQSFEKVLSGGPYFQTIYLTLNVRWLVLPIKEKFPHQQENVLGLSYLRLNRVSIKIIIVKLFKSCTVISLAIFSVQTSVTGFLNTFVIISTGDISYPMDDVIFPGIVICNKDPISRSFITEMNLTTDEVGITCFLAFSWEPAHKEGWGRSQEKNPYKQ